MATRPVELKRLQRGFRKLPDEHQDVLRKLFNVPEKADVTQTCGVIAASLRPVRRVRNFVPSWCENSATETTLIQYGTDYHHNERYRSIRTASGSQAAQLQSEAY
jgi:2-succinyl-5-enolpyruvyl-6-hydroxy-3-cyclohexene-1-carboxylate synthase